MLFGPFLNFERSVEGISYFFVYQVKKVYLGGDIGVVTFIRQILKIGKEYIVFEIICD